MTTLVRCCTDNTVFRIDSETTEALSCSYYDPYCYSDPKPDVEYMEYGDWLKQCDKRWSKYYTRNERVSPEQIRQHFGLDR